MEVEEVGKRIGEFAKENRLSVNELSDIIGVPQTTLNSYVNGSRKTSLEVIQKLLNAYPDINTQWLILGYQDNSKRHFTKNTIGAYSESQSGRQTIHMGVVKYDETKFELERLKNELEKQKAIIASKDEIINTKNELIELLKNR